MGLKARLRKIKRKLLHELENFRAGQLRHSNSRANFNQVEKSALLIPPGDDPGSFGDDAMLQVCIDYLKLAGFKRFGIVSFGLTAKWDHLRHLTDVIYVSVHKDKLQLINDISQYDRVYCLGADVIDGFYSDQNTLKRLRVIELSARVGVKTTILGCSFNDRPTPSSVEALSNLPASVRICCRDPLSQKRFIQHVHRSAELVADLAFLLSPETNSSKVIEIYDWIQQQQANERVVIGFNGKNLYHGESLELKAVDLAKVFADTLIELFQSHQNLSFLMIPHDIRGTASDAVLAQEISSHLPSFIQPYQMQVPTPTSPAEIKAICAKLDFVVTGRMHLAVACLGQATPVIGITYQGKFEGLFEHFNLKDMTIEPEKAVQLGCLEAFISERLPKRHDIQHQLQSELGKVKVLANSNFADILAQPSFIDVTSQEVNLIRDTATLPV